MEVAGRARDELEGTQKQLVGLGRGGRKKEGPGLVMVSDTHAFVLLGSDPVGDDVLWY